VNKPRVSLSYRDAGVDIDAGDALVDAIRPIAGATRRPGLLAGVGGFGAMFEIPPGQTSQYGFEHRRRWHQACSPSNPRHDTIGIDLVAMCVDIIAGR
jgi:phosphoribosylformylglycinamidine cyclo-ligase